MHRHPVSRLALALAVAIAATPTYAQDPATTGSAPLATGQPTTLNLKSADIGVLIQTVSEITGKSFIVDPNVQGKVTVVSARPMGPEELYETFQSVLRVHGYAAVPAGGKMVKIVPEAVAVQDGGTRATTSSGADELVTRVIEVKHVPATDLVTLLRPLLPQQSQLIAHGSSNSLLITDRAGNAERIASLVARIDTASDGEVEVIALRHASAAEISRTLTALDQGSVEAKVPGALKLVADERTNSILLSGDRAQKLRARTMIAHLDTPLSSGESTQVVYIRYAKAEELVPILEGVAETLTGVAAKEGEAGAATIQTHGETNALIISASPAVFRELQAVIRQLDVRRAQVLVEAVIAEVSDDLADELGVQWQSTTLDGLDDTGLIGGTNFNGSTGTGGIVPALTNPLGAVSGNGLNLGYVGGSLTLPIGPNGSDVTVFQIGALVKALRGDGRANILSNPSVMTLDHHEAEFKVVQEVPFITGQYTNTSTTGGVNQPTNPFQTVERQDVGIILKVTPHVNEGDAVRLDLYQEVSQLAPNVNGAADLITSKRELTTSVLVPDGGMLVLGGLRAEESRDNISGVPGVSRIPLLGNLFKSRASSRSKRNLMVFLRPRILRDAVTETALSNEKYNYLRAEQLKRRENHELRYRNDQPVLPELPPDLMRNPPVPSGDTIDAGAGAPDADRD